MGVKNIQMANVIMLPLVRCHGILFALAAALIRFISDKPLEKASAREGRRHIDIVERRLQQTLGAALAYLITQRNGNESAFACVRTRAAHVSIEHSIIGHEA